MSWLSRTSIRRGALLLGVLAATAAGPLPGQDLAVTHARVLPVTGPPLEDATVLVRDGTIRAVGTDVDVPDGIRTIDGSGKVVTPGLFDANTRLGLIEVGAVGDTRDYAMRDDPVRAAFDVTEGLNPNSTLIPVARLAGVTTVVSSPAGGLVAGQSAVIDLAGSSVDEMLAKGGAAMVASYGGGVVGGARGAAALRLRETLEDARFWGERREAFDRGASRPLSQSRLDLEAMQPVLAGERPLVVNVHRASDIRAVMDIADAYGLDLVIQGGAEAWMVADRLAEAEVPVILKPLTNNLGSFSRLGARFDNAARLHEAGVRVALSTFSSHRAEDLRWEVGNAIRFGLPAGAALRAVTLHPARAFGVDDRYGSLEPGKVGNLVVWSGDPFELSSRPETVIIRGEVVPSTSRPKELLERYRTLDRQRPPAYGGGG